MGPGRLLRGKFALVKRFLQCDEQSLVLGVKPVLRAEETPEGKSLHCQNKQKGEKEYQ